MPVLAVKAVSISSSAFFIEAAANTVRVLSSAVAGEEAAPHSRTKAANNPAKRCIRALHVNLRRVPARARLHARKSGVGSGRNATTEALFRGTPQTYGHGGVAGWADHNRPRLWAKGDGLSTFRLEAPF